MMLEAFGKGIMGTTLLYPYEIRSEEGVFEEIPELKLPDQMVGLAEDIIDKLSGAFEPEMFEDRYENAMIELIPLEASRAARAEGEVPCPTAMWST
jgi:DNA end-binding protein Ku